MSVTKAANMPKKLSRGREKLPLVKSCRIIPDDIQPECQEMCLVVSTKQRQKQNKTEEDKQFANDKPINNENKNPVKKRKKNCGNTVLSQASQSKYDIRYAMNKAKEKKTVAMTQEDGSDFLSVGITDYFKQSKKSKKSPASKAMQDVICLDDSFEEMHLDNDGNERKLLQEIMQGTDDNIPALNKLNSLSMDELIKAVSANLDLIRMPDRFVNRAIRLELGPEISPGSSDFEDVPIPTPPYTHSQQIDRELSPGRTDTNNYDGPVVESVHNVEVSSTDVEVKFLARRSDCGFKAFEAAEVTIADHFTHSQQIERELSPRRTDTNNYDGPVVESVHNVEVSSTDVEVKFPARRSDCGFKAFEAAEVTIADRNSGIFNNHTNLEQTFHEDSTNVKNASTSEVHSRANSPIVDNRTLTTTQALKVVDAFKKNSEKCSTFELFPDDCDLDDYVIPDHKMDDDVGVIDDNLVACGIDNISPNHTNLNTDLCRNSIVKQESTKGRVSSVRPLYLADDKSPSLVSSGSASKKTSRVKKSLQFNDPAPRSPPTANFKLLDLDSDDDLFADYELDRQIQLNQEKNVLNTSLCMKANETVEYAMDYEPCDPLEKLSPDVVLIDNDQGKQTQPYDVELKNLDLRLQTQPPDVEIKDLDQRVLTQPNNVEMNFDLRLQTQPHDVEIKTLDQRIRTQPHDVEIKDFRSSQRNRSIKTAIVRPFGFEETDSGWITLPKKPPPTTSLPISSNHRPKKPNLNQNKIMNDYFQPRSSSGKPSVMSRVAPLLNKPSSSNSFSTFDLIPDDWDLNTSPFDVMKSSTPTRSHTPVVQHSTPLGASSLHKPVNHSTPDRLLNDDDLSDGALEAIRIVEETNALKTKKGSMVLLSSDSELSDGALEAIKAVEQFVQSQRATREDFQSKRATNLNLKPGAIQQERVSTSFYEMLESRNGSVSARSEEAVFRLWSSDDDGDELFVKKPVLSKTLETTPKRHARSKKTKKIRQRANPFLDDEAQLSGSSGSGDDDNTSGLDELDSSFLDERLAPTQAPDVDMTAKYLSTVRSPRVMAGGFKIPTAPGRMDIDVFSQVVRNDEDYVEDSFCVRDYVEEDDEPLSELEIAEQKLQQKRKRRRNPATKKTPTEPIGRKRKRKRIVLLDSSSDEDLERAHQKSSTSSSPAIQMKPGNPVRHLPNRMSEPRDHAAVTVTENRVSVCLAEPSSVQPLILIGSRPIASAPEITISLRAKFKFKVDVRSNPGADFIAGCRLGINRVTLSDFCNGSPAIKTSLRESLQKLTELFVKPVLIVEDDKTKSAPKTVGCHKDMWAKHSAKRIARVQMAGITVLFTKDKEETAEVIAKLAMNECKTGQGVITDFKEFTPQLEARIKFYTTLPGVNVARAMMLCRKFSTITSMLTICDSIPNIRTVFGVRQSTAALIFNSLMSMRS